jgi:hypothetical protein
MKNLTFLLIVLILTGCATVKNMLPSKWDDNQAKVAIDIRQDAIHFDCTGDQKLQLTQIAKDVEWFELYAQSKGTEDVAKLNTVFFNTVKEFQERVKAGPVSPMYCDLKRKIMIQQSEIIAKAVQNRF